MPEKEKKTEEAEPKKKKLPLIPIIIGVTTLLGALMVGKIVLGNKRPETKAEIAKQDATETFQIPLEDFLVNLDGGGGHYLRTTITLGMNMHITADEAKEDTAPIRDAILSVLSSQTYDGLANASQRESLKEEIKKAVDKELGKPDVAEVYFTAFATQ